MWQSLSLFFILWNFITEDHSDIDVTWAAVESFINTCDWFIHASKRTDLKNDKSILSWSSIANTHQWVKFENEKKLNQKSFMHKIRQHRDIKLKND